MLALRHGRPWRAAARRRFPFLRRSLGDAVLLVDGDAVGAESAAQAVAHLGRCARCTVFGAGTERRVERLRRLLAAENAETAVELRAVPRQRREGQPVDEAIHAEIRQLEAPLALLTCDKGFAKTVAQAIACGKSVVLFVPASSRGTAEAYRAIGAKVVLLDTNVAYRVRAVLAPDGGGVAQHLERPLAVTTGEPLEVMQKVVKEFLHGLGYYSDQDVSPIPGITKFWWWNSLGPLTVYPSQCAVEVMHSTTAQRGSSSWQRNPGHLAFFLPIGSHRARADQIREYGSEIARAIFQGGGPFMLKDSEDLVPRALRRLKYLDDHRNADLREAMLVFANKSKNKGKLRALDLLPDFHPERQLRMAFLANQCGKWQLPSDRRLRHQLVRQKYLQHPGAEEEEVLQAMQDFSRKHGLPTMRTYNGYVFQLGSFMSRNDPSRRDILHFK